MDIIKLPLKHVQMECLEDGHCYPECYACGLGWCSVCGGAEGTLTTHCLGKNMTGEEGDKVYKEGWDYKNNNWVKLTDGKRLLSEPMFY